MLRLGIDLGGTKTEIVALDEEGRKLRRRRVSTPTGDYAGSLNDKPLLQDLTELLEREVRIENDAKYFVLSEATDGAAAGQHVVFGVILGTGVGGGIVVDGKLLSGPNRIAGEWGHNSLS